MTRFPPEPSGYLHVGHIKASMLNYHYAKMYGGKMILRFDDTNPITEKLEFVENIQTDLKTLEIVPDKVSYSSDFFKEIQDYCRKLIQDGNAYADDTPADKMKEERDVGTESKCRAFTVEEILSTSKICLQDAPLLSASAPSSTCRILLSVLETQCSIVASRSPITALAPHTRLTQPTI